MVAGNRQLFGEDPVQVRESDHYRLEYIQSFVEKWDELIDWEMRAESEGDFFIRPHLDSLGTPDYYWRVTGEVGLREKEFSAAISEDYLARMKKGLGLWI